MIAKHHAQFTSEELSTLTELCTKHTLATDTTQCPCCSEPTDGSDHFYRHLAKHLEDIATLSLMPNLPCEFSVNVDPDLQFTHPIPSHSDQESRVRSTGPLQQPFRGRSDEHDTQNLLRRTRSAPCWERGLGTGFYDNVPLGDSSEEPFSSQGFRRHSWNSLVRPTSNFAVDLDSPELRRPDNALDPGTTSSSVAVGHELTSLVDQVAPASSGVHEERDSIPENDPKAFELDEQVFRAIFSLEPGYQDLEVVDDDNGPVCFVKFNSIVSAFRAAYKLNHRPTSDSNATRFSIDFSGKSLSVGLATGPHSGLPLLNAVEQYPLSYNVIPFSHHGGLKQYYDHEQTDQSSWEAETYARGSGSLDFPSD